MKAFILAIIILFSCSAFAQEKRLVQFSGLILHSDSLVPVPYASIANRSRSNRGTISDFKGFFSLVVGIGDTIQIAALGYKTQEVIIPQDYKLKNYTITFRMKPTSINIPTVYIFPWPTVEQFRQAFLKLKLPDDDMARAQRNLDQQVMNDIGNHLAWDGAQNNRYYFAQQSEKLYWAGQTRPNPLLDVVKLAQFMQLLSEGKINFRNDPEY